jgi:XRE family transcriptional regulator, fatty acid utilization regulator
MADKKNHYKILFGIKIKALRTARGLSFMELSQQTSVSVSYLNEIEKGKKYPSADKIEVLADVLDTTVEELTSEHLSANLAPVEALLNSNFLNELPLDLFGIELNKIAEIIAKAPIKVGAFISTLLDLARTYNVHEENFYNRALRSYQELHNNYFEDIEEAIDRFVGHQNLEDEQITTLQLAKILEQKYRYVIDYQGLDAYTELAHLRSLTVFSQKKILLSSKLNEKQVTYQLAKELGFCVLSLQERIDLRQRATTFEQVLNNYKAAYFAVGLLIPKKSMIRDMETFFAKPAWDGDFLLSLLEKYQVSTETLFQRMNVLPHHFGINRLFFMRIVHDTTLGQYHIDKELHLSQKHPLHSNGLSEHYCRRWAAISSFQELTKNETQAFIQRAIVHGTSDEYISLTLSRTAYPSVNQQVSVTIGFLVDKKLKKHVQFYGDQQIPKTEVGVTCERCPIQNCAQRAAAPIQWEAKQQRKAIREALDRVLE